MDHGVSARFVCSSIVLPATLDNTCYLQAKMVYVASLNDQVVPIYSGLFTAASHPRILRALYIDGDAYQLSLFTPLIIHRDGLLT